MQKNSGTTQATDIRKASRLLTVSLALILLVSGATAIQTDTFEDGAVLDDGTWNLTQISGTDGNATIVSGGSQIDGNYSVELEATDGVALERNYNPGIPALNFSSIRQSSIQPPNQHTSGIDITVNDPNGTENTLWVRYRDSATAGQIKTQVCTSGSNTITNFGNTVSPGDTVDLSVNQVNSTFAEATVDIRGGGSDSITFRMFCDPQNATITSISHRHFNNVNSPTHVYDNLAYDIAENPRPLIENFNTEPSNPILGDYINLTAEVTDDDTVENVTLSLWREGTNLFTDQSMVLESGDTYRYDNATQAQQANYTAQIRAFDNEGDNRTLNFTFEVDNEPPSVDTVEISPSSPSGGDLIDIKSNVSDPEDNLTSVSYTLDEDGVQVANGSMSFTGVEWEAVDIYNVSEGSSYNATVTAEDDGGNQDSNSTIFVIPDPPVFNFENPANNSLFITSTDVDVQFDYGGETSEEGNYILIVNGVVEDMTPEVDGTNSEGIHTETYTPPVDAFWVLHFDSTTTGKTYTSDIFRTFYVRESEVDIDLLNPSGGASFPVDFGGSTNIEFNWTEDSQGFNGNYYYNFRVRNDSDNSLVENRTSADLSGGSVRTQSETVNLIPAGQYTWIVKAVDASSGTQYDLQQRSFTVEEPATFTQSIDQPSDGTTFNIPLDETTRDVNVSYTVSANTEDVVSDLLLDGNTVDSQTTTQNNTVTYDVTLQNVSLGQHTLRLESQDTAGNTENTSSTFTVQQTGIYDLTIDSPGQGDQFETPVDSNFTDVNSSYTVDVGSVNVTTTVTLNGQQVDQRTFDQHGTTQTFDLTFDNLSEQSYTLDFSGNDTEGNTETETVSFDVVSDDVPPTVEEVRLTPRLEDLLEGDTPDLYFRGTEGSDPVEYVNVTFIVNGTVEKEVQIPREELVIGSFQKQISDFIQVEQSWIGEPIDIVVDAVDSQGRVGSAIITAVLGNDAEPQVRLVRPENGLVIEQPSSSPEDVQFEWEMKTTNDPLNWTFYVKERGFSNPFTQVETDQLGYTAGSYVGRTRFYSMNNQLGNSFGNFTWKVEVEDVATGELNDAYGNFEVRQETNDPLLNLITPYNHEVFYIPSDQTEGDIEFDWSYNVKQGDTADVSLKIDNRSISLPSTVRTVSGDSSDSFTVNGLDLGLHEVQLKMVRSDGATVTESHEFSVQHENISNVDENDIVVTWPDEGDTVYQDSPETAQWFMFANTTGNTTFYIADSGGSVVRTFEGSGGYDLPGNLLVYSATFNGSVPIGSYHAWAEASLADAPDLRTENVSFTVEDIQPPELVGVTSPQNNTVFSEGDTINWSFNSEIFDEQALVSLKYREVGEYGATTVTAINQSANSQETIQASEALPPGEYAWFVQWDINPVFVSESYYFTVESSTADPPTINPLNPSQNDTFTPAPANVTFDYNVEVFSQADSTVDLQISRNSTGLSNFTTVASDVQSDGDDEVMYSHVEELEEDGYFWKVRVQYPNGTVYESGEIGFAVGNATVPQPQDEEEEQGFGLILGGFFKNVSTGIGDAFSTLDGTALFVIASLFTGIAGILVSRWTLHSELGIMTMAVSAVTFVYVGWYEPWVGIILFLIAAGIFIFSLRTIHGGS